MMSTRKFFFGACVAITIMTALHVRDSKSQDAKDKSPKYYLELISIVDTKPPGYILAVDQRPAFAAPGVGYSSLTSAPLRQYIGNLPKGSTLVYAPGYLPVIQPSAQEWDEFRGFCKNKGIKFVTHTSSVYPDNE